MQDILSTFQMAIGGTASRLWPLYIVTMLLIAFVVYRHQKSEGGFLRWLFPAEIYLHRSHMVDIQLFLVGRLLRIFGMFQVIGVGAVISSTIVNHLGGRIIDGSLSPVLIALIMLLGSDFSVYWVHRLHHEFPTLWPFHAVHHSAEVMTPVTVYRKHPIYDVISSFATGVILGTVQGLLLSFFTGTISVTQLMGINAFYFAFNMLGANLRHTHVWLSFGRVLEHVFISPAQHQVHHSVELRHYNKNYGEVLAIWDWMFGTLYIPEGRETLRFGLGDAEGNEIEQLHPTLAAALMTPIRQSLATLRRPKPAPGDRVTPAE